MTTKLDIAIEVLEQARDGKLRMNAEQFKSMENTIHTLKKAKEKMESTKKGAKAIG